MRKLFVQYKAKRVYQVFLFLQKEGGIPWIRLTASSIGMSFSEYFLIHLITQVVVEQIPQTGMILPLMLYLFGLFLFSTYYFYSCITTVTYDLIYRLRYRLINQLRHTSLGAFENLETLTDSEQASTQDASSIYVDLESVLQAMANKLPYILKCLSSVVFINFGILYLLLMEPLVGVIFLAAILLGTFFIYFRAYRLDSYHIRMYLLEVKSIALIRHIIQGFTALKLSPKRNEHLFKHTREVIEDWGSSYSKGNTLANQKTTYFQSCYLLAFLGILLWVDIFAPMRAHELSQIAVILLLLFGPILRLVHVYPFFIQLNTAVQRLQDFETILQQGKESDQFPSSDAPLPSKFQEIVGEDLAFNYTNVADEILYCFGPVNFRIPQGSITFLKGDNGSGKSTLLKLLTRLYLPLSGNLTLDQQILPLQQYRNLFSVVFAESHLFDQLYGLTEVNEQRVTALLEKMGLQEKTRLAGKYLPHTNLSSGQKKRLALIIALLEDKPIYVFDEWAAHQDPYFRDYFYLHLLPEMKQQGKTVIASTHDARYLNMADQVIELEHGWVVGEEVVRPLQHQVTQKRYRIVRQRNERDCGAACLASICLYDGRRVSFHEMRRLTNTGPHGSSMLDLSSGFEAMGYEPQAVQANLPYLVQEAQLPVVAHWYGNHWIVVYEATENKVIVADPAKGLLNLPLDQFTKGWTKYTILLNRLEEAH